MSKSHFNTHFLYAFRVQYAALKEECRVMFPLIGSGRFISAPVITEDGDPILDPIVLQELNAAKEPTSVGQVGNSYYVQSQSSLISLFLSVGRVLGCCIQ